MNLGHRIWVFPDGDLPPLDPYDPSLKRIETHGHESLVVLNAGSKQVNPILRVYFSDREPWTLALAPIAPERVCCYRMDEPVGVEKRTIPPGQYALVLECDYPVIAQIGRMDIRQPNLAYYTAIGFPSDPS
mgnify:CR=1 FL=1